ncbi:MAG TPA: DUF72 domain-containing protein [Candidatus Limnocylindria bacterium]|nr:DUF72 domain-containing protein [Candidatus Limnocylindria bacterium]
MARIYAGTSGWAYSTWRPKFYPAKLGSADFLNYYANRLNSVEINYSFLHSLTKELLTEWIAATPANFIFAVKAPQMITHMNRLRGTRRLTRQFISSLRPLAEAEKLGPVLFQLPPNFKCSPELLEEFLGNLPAQTRIAFEFRHESWFTDEVCGLLRKANVALCHAESEKLVTPHVQTADFSYLRLRKDKYSIKARRAVAGRVTDLSRGGEVYVYFKHERTPEGAFQAEELLSKASRE